MGRGEPGSIAFSILWLPSASESLKSKLHLNRADALARADNSSNKSFEIIISMQASTGDSKRHSKTSRKSGPIIPSGRSPPSSSLQPQTSESQTYCLITPVYAQKSLHLHQSPHNKQTMKTETTTRENYEEPAMEIIKLETNTACMLQDSYHYEPGWDD